MIKYFFEYLSTLIAVHIRQKRCEKIRTLLSRQKRAISGVIIVSSLCEDALYSISCVLLRPVLKHLLGICPCAQMRYDGDLATLHIL